VPTSSDDVFFDAASGAVTVTVATVSANARSLNFTGFTGTFAGSTNSTVAGSVTFVAGMTTTYSGTMSITGTGTLTSAGKTLGGVTINASGQTVTLGDALTLSGGVTVTAGTFTTNNFNVTATQLASSNSNTRTINLGSSTVTLTGTSAINFSTSTNLTFNAGTSTVTTAGSVINAGSGQTFHNVSFTEPNLVTLTINGANTFNNLTISGRTTAGIKALSVDSNQTINGTLTLSAGTNATARTFVRSDTIGTTRTLTCAAVASLTDIDFRDITIAGAAAPVSGTRLGDCRGNSGITFPAAKTVYYATTGGGNWGAANAWSFTSLGAADPTAFPLSQDTVIVESSKPNTGSTITINAAYNIGTIDMSARTGNTMTLATGSQTPAIYGNWINGTGTTLTGTGVMTFAGRGNQAITSAGKTFTQGFTINTPSGSVTLQDAYVTSNTTAGGLILTAGTFDANNYNVTLANSSPSFQSNNTNVRTLAIGSGTWTIPHSGSIAWQCTTATNMTVTGTGILSLTSASAKTFAGGGIQTYPTLNQGGTGTLTVTGSNKFAGLTNTAIGRIQFTGGTTNEFTSFTINGTVGNLLQLGSTNTTQAILIKTTAWNVGANSTDAGNNTGLSFTAGGNDYLSISYINGQVSSGAVTHDTTGALPGLTAVVLGLSTRFRAFTTSGVLAGPGSEVAGTSVRFRAFGSTGALVGPGSAVAGDSNRFRAFNTTGDLFGAGSVISGDARRYRVFDATGEIPGVFAQIVGTANVSITHDTSGALTGPGSEMSGVSVLINLYPNPSDVREGVQYGPGGMYVGTLTVVDGQTIIRIRSITERL
jgi:hypothetical protein